MSGIGYAFKSFNQVNVYGNRPLQQPLKMILEQVPSLKQSWPMPEILYAQDEFHKNINPGSQFNDNTGTTIWTKLSGIYVYSWIRKNSDFF